MTINEKWCIDRLVVKPERNTVGFVADAGIKYFVAKEKCCEKVINNTMAEKYPRMPKWKGS